MPLHAATLANRKKELAMSRNGIQGKVVLIAGGAKNLGGLLAREFARAGAGDGNRTHVFSLEGCCSTIELHPRRPSL
jgi:hypothetical protein